MARPFTPIQRAQNNRFLVELARGGNIRLAARAIGCVYGTIQHRRRACPAFAQRVDAALALAQARLARAGGEHGPIAASAPLPAPIPAAAPAAAPADARRTVGGEAVVVRRRDGRLQVRRAQPGKLTRAAEQAFLAALSATCNVMLSAAAAGANHAAFYRRCRTNPAFAREMRLALEQGYERLEMAMLESVAIESAGDDTAWRDNEAPSMPPMTFNQMLQLMYLHQKQARLDAEPPHIRRRRGESTAAQSFRLSAMYEARQQRARDAFDIAQAARRARGAPTPFGPQPWLPDLAQVTGWSRADPDKAPHDAETALFDGWRIDNLTPEQAEDGRRKRRGKG